MDGTPEDAAYDAIRASTTDVAAIARNTGLKPRNVQKVKEHLFYDAHLLDRYVRYGVPAELRRFDASLDIARAWRRLEAGIFTEADRQLLQHEMAEAWYMRRYGPSYDRAHRAAQRGFPSPME